MADTHRTPHKHITRKHSTRNQDGTMKTIDQLMRTQLTVLQYGRYIASQQKGSN
jgi:hypothetical protein